MSIFMRGLGLQNSFRRRGDAHHGIASVLVVRAVPKVLVRNVRDVVGTENYIAAQKPNRCGPRWLMNLIAA